MYPPGTIYYNVRTCKGLPTAARRVSASFKLKQELNLISKKLDLPCLTKLSIWPFESRVEEQTQELYLHGTWSSIYHCLFLYSQPKGMLHTGEFLLCSVQWVYNFIKSPQYDCDIVYVACSGIFVPPHTDNWVKSHSELTILLLQCPPYLTSRYLRAWRMIYGCAYKAFVPFHHNEPSLQGFCYS